MQKHSKNKLVYQISGVLSIIAGFAGAWYAAQLWIPLSPIVFAAFVALGVVLLRASSKSKTT
jgi:hypothetical protein